LFLHAADPRRGRGQRQRAAFSAAGDGAGLYDIAEQAQVGQIETHGAALSFVIGEGCLQETGIAPKA
jgi:hypothetical protein